MYRYKAQYSLDCENGIENAVLLKPQTCLLYTSRDGDIVTIRVTGTGFLYNMVRIISGTLIEVGNGQYPPERVKTILEACNREMAGPTAPAQGLTLMGIEFFD